MLALHAGCDPGQLATAGLADDDSPGSPQPSGGSLALEINAASVRWISDCVVAFSAAWSALSQKILPGALLDQDSNPSKPKAACIARMLKVSFWFE
jgi:hypothetical protein